MTPFLLLLLLQKSAPSVSFVRETDRKPGVGGEKREREREREERENMDIYIHIYRKKPIHYYLLLPIPS
jgi:hypothetical protein